MTYNTGDLMDRVKDLEKRIHQLEVSPRGGLFQVTADFRQTDSTVNTVIVSTWADFQDYGPEVSLSTGRRALVLFTGHPTIRTTDRFTELHISYRVSGASTRDPGNMSTSMSSAVREAQAVSDSLLGPDLNSNTITGFYVQGSLTPGVNTFTLMGRYGGQRNTFDALPTCKDRAILVIPLDV